MRKTIVVAVIFIAASWGMAQPNPLNISPQFLSPHLSQAGDTFSVCIAEDSYLRDLELAVAQEIADVLLLNLEPVFFALPWGSRPYDYALSTESEDIFVLLTNECDAIFSVQVPKRQIDDWLAISRPLFSTRYVLTTADEEISRLGDIPPGNQIGVRISSTADLDLAAYNLALSKDQRWQRLQYQDQEGLAKRIADGTVQAGFIWKPALSE